MRWARPRRLVPTTIRVFTIMHQISQNPQTQGREGRGWFKSGPFWLRTSLVPTSNRSWVSRRPFRDIPDPTPFDPFQYEFCLSPRCPCNATGTTGAPPTFFSDELGSCPPRFLEKRSIADPVRERFLIGRFFGPLSSTFRSGSLFQDRLWHSDFEMVMGRIFFDVPDQIALVEDQQL